MQATNSYSNDACISLYYIYDYTQFIQHTTSIIRAFIFKKDSIIIIIVVMAPSLETTNTNTIESKNPNNTKQEEQQQEEDGMLFAMNLAVSVVFPLAVKSAIELGIFNLIAKSGEGSRLSAEDIATQIGTKNPNAPIMLDRLLRLLASHSMLSCSVSDDDDDQQNRVSSNPKKILYGLTINSKYFVTNEEGLTFGNTLNLPLDKIFLDSWTELKGAIMEGGVAFDRVYGMHAFEYPSVDPRFNEVFNKAMISHTTIVMKRIIECYQGFDNINKLVDVGGGLGMNLKLITSKYPYIKGVNFDLPHVIEHAPTYAGVEHVGGDMFECVPNGDAIFMKWILHDWSDEHCLKLLKNCYKAIPDDGKVIAVDTILPDIPDTTTYSKVGFKADILMMTQNPGGKERTQHEFIHLATASGFSGIRFVSCVSGFWVMEFYK